ncbi:MAG: hypothetical protein ABI705_09440 [Aestuariivirga sp.]
MIRLAAAAFSFALLTAPALAVEFEPNDQGQIEFTMPSDNVGCIYTPAGGTDTYETADGGAELSCDRIAPSYIRVVLAASGKAKRYTNVGDASCCGAENYFAYGEVWSEGPFSCISSTTGLACTRGAHGFSMSRKAVTAY